MASRAIRIITNDHRWFRWFRYCMILLCAFQSWCLPQDRPPNISNLPKCPGGGVDICDGWKWFHLFRFFIYSIYCFFEVGLLLYVFMFVCSSMCLFIYVSKSQRETCFPWWDLPCLDSKNVTAAWIENTTARTDTKQWRVIICEGSSSASPGDYV